MPSYISSSESTETRKRSRLNRATWLLLGTSLLVYAGAEGAARLGFGRISKIHHRIITEREAALAIRSSPPGAPRTVLVIGNSLLLKGLDFPEFAKQVSPTLRASRFVIEQTTYYDWYFTLRTLFRHGVRADTVVLGFNAPSITTDEIRGEFMSRFVFDIQDIWPAARASHADLTTTTSLYMAHFSTFYGGRSELRTVLINRIFPDAWLMWQRSVNNAAIIPSDAELIPAIARRLKTLDDLCREYGARFVFLMPPTPQRGDEATVQAGKSVGVSVLRPIPNVSFGSEFYEDGFHLNERGAAIFTEAAARALLQDR
jgi:hypothetical protein